MFFDVKILKLMFKEEFRLQASFFNRSYFLFSSLLFLFVSLTLSFLLGISFSVLLFAALARLGLILVAASMVFLSKLTAAGKAGCSGLPEISCVFYKSCHMKPLLIF